MGSRGRVRSDESTPISGVYSNVDSHYTPMSDEDREQVGGSDWSTRYFQSGTSFKINEALRDIAENGGNLNDALELAGVSDDDLIGVTQTIDTMDRNMQPIDKAMSVVRLVDSDYMNHVLTSLGVSRDTMGAVHDLSFFGRLSDTALSEIKDKIVGARVTEAGFMSSTYNLSLDDSAFLGRRIKLDFSDVPKGTRGMFSPTSSESEFVFARGTKYEFSDVSWDNGDHRLVLKVKIVK